MVHPIGTAPFAASGGRDLGIVSDGDRHGDPIGHSLGVVHDLDGMPPYDGATLWARSSRHDVIDVFNGVPLWGRMVLGCLVERSYEAAHIVPLSGIETRFVEYDSDAIDAVASMRCVFVRWG